jgi:hypothetical protein
MKYRTLLAAAVLLGTNVAAQADTIDFTQWGVDTSLSSPLAGVTAGGNAFTISNGGSTNAFQPRQQGVSFTGNFTSGTNLLWSTTANTVDITFTNPLSTITLGAESVSYGAYTETFQAFDGSALVDTVSASGFDSGNTNGTPVIFLTLSAADITSIAIITTNNGAGLGFTISSLSGAVATPLPAALPLFATGLGAMGLIGWRRKRKAQAA